MGADQVSSVITAAVPAGALTITIAETTALSPLSSHFVSFATPARLAKEKTPARLVASFARSLAGVRIDSLAVDLRALLGRLTRQLRPALQGIVVGGNRAGTVQILDNLVEGTIQGIHVGVSDRPREAPLLAGAVVVARNIVHAVVPAAYDRDRHAVFVGNARSVHVLDTTATLTRPDADIVRARTPVEAVRIHGVLGPFLAVRQTSAAGFAIGVRVVPLAPFPSPKLRMWLVAETVAPDGSKGAMLPGANDPAAPVDGERNVP